MSHPRNADNYAAAEYRTVTQGVADYCAEHGHVTGVVADFDPDLCARCGHVVRPATITAPTAPNRKDVPMFGISAHRAPSAGIAALYGPVVHAASLNHPALWNVAIVALHQDDGAGLGSRGTHGVHAAMISEAQLSKELTALHYLFPSLPREALLYGWEGQCSPHDWTPDWVAADYSNV